MPTTWGTALTTATWHFLRSRNRLLTEADRQRAPCIYQALAWAVQAVSAGETPSATGICEEVSRRIAAGGADVDYVEVCNWNAVMTCRCTLQITWQPNKT